MPSGAPVVGSRSHRDGRGTCRTCAGSGSFSCHDPAGRTSSAGHVSDPSVAQRAPAFGHRARIPVAAVAWTRARTSTSASSSRLGGRISVELVPDARRTRLTQSVVGEVDRHGDLDRPRHVVVGLVDEERARDERRRAVAVSPHFSRNATASAPSGATSLMSFLSKLTFTHWRTCQSSSWFSS